MRQNTKKIFIVLPSFDTGGAQQFVLNLCSFLKNEEIDVTVIALRKSKNHIYTDRFKTIDVNIIDFQKKRASYSFVLLRQYIKEYRPNVVLSTVHNVDLLLAIIKLTLNKFQLIIRKASFPYKKGFKEKVLHYDRIQNLISDRIVVLTKEMKDHYINELKVNEEKLVVINNMANKEIIFEASKEKNELEFKFERDKFYIIAVGRLVYEKGYDILLKSYSLIKKKYSNIELILIGEGNEQKHLEDIICKDNIMGVHFMGFQKNPYSYISRSNVFVLSSRHEGFPNVILEAFACKIPVVATKCTSGPREIITDQHNGLLANVDDIEDIANQIEKIYTNEINVNQIIDTAYKGLENYSLNKIGAVYMRIISEEVNKRINYT